MKTTKTLYLVSQATGEIVEAIAKEYKKYYQILTDKIRKDTINVVQKYDSSFFDNKEQAEILSKRIKDIVQTREKLVRISLLIKATDLTRKSDFEKILEVLKEYPRQFYFSVKGERVRYRFIGFKTSSIMKVSYDDKHVESRVVGDMSDVVFDNDDDKATAEYYQELELIYEAGKKGFRKLSCASCTSSGFCSNSECLIDELKYKDGLFNGEKICKDFDKCN